jgi:pilus assembly protein Flp/PilA
MRFLKKLWRDGAGAAAIEYGLIAALVSLAGISAFTNLGTAITTKFNATSTSLSAS